MCQTFEPDRACNKLRNNFVQSAIYVKSAVPFSHDTSEILVIRELHERQEQVNIFSRFYSVYTTKFCYDCTNEREIQLIGSNMQIATID